MIREHWGIENSVRRMLDLAFNADQSRLHKDNGPENLAVICRIALNLLGNKNTARVGIQARRSRLVGMKLPSVKLPLQRAIVLA